MTPESIERATKSATEAISEALEECAWCGWPFGPDLMLSLRRGQRAVVCINPWRCAQRRETLAEHRGWLGQGVEGL